MDSSFVEIGCAERGTSIFCLGMIFAFKGNENGFPLILTYWRGKKGAGAQEQGENSLVGSEQRAEN